MSTREHHIQNVKCETCGSQGSVSYFENDQPHTPFEPEVDKVVGKFLTETVGQKIRVTCKECGTVFSL